MITRAAYIRSNTVLLLLLLASLLLLLLFLLLLYFGRVCFVYPVYCPIIRVIWLFLLFATWLSEHVDKYYYYYYYYYY
jgi:uncharacterized protein YqgC (DUF456 family)